jgi:hypothetical protein
MRWTPIIQSPYEISFHGKAVDLSRVSQSTDCWDMKRTVNMKLLICLPQNWALLWRHTLWSCCVSVSSLLCERPHGVKLKYIKNVVWELSAHKRNVLKLRSTERSRKVKARAAVYCSTQLHPVLFWGICLFSFSSPNKWETRRNSVIVMNCGIALCWGECI